MNRDGSRRPGLLNRALLLRPATLDRAQRGFAAAASPATQAKLDAVVQSFASGFNHAVVPDSAPEPGTLPHELTGFAVEGAAMGATVLDLITFSGGRRLSALAGEYGDRYTHLIHVGAGWAFARLHSQPWHRIRFGQPLLRWLAWDGWGFHQAFFAPQRVFTTHLIDRAARSEVRPVADQGFGRALWFYAGAEPARVAEIIAGFPPERRCDLWAGIGLASCYTGAQPPPVLDQLLGAAHGYRDHLGQGAAFAAKAHVLSGEVPPGSAASIEVLTGATAEIAAGWTDQALTAPIGAASDLAAYQAWRNGIRVVFSRHNGGVFR
jgi:hypothetical protein